MGTTAYATGYEPPAPATGGVALFAVAEALQRILKIRCTCEGIDNGLQRLQCERQQMNAAVRALIEILDPEGRR